MDTNYTPHILFYPILFINFILYFEFLFAAVLVLLWGKKVKDLQKSRQGVSVIDRNLKLVPQKRNLINECSMPHSTFSNFGNHK